MRRRHRACQLLAACLIIIGWASVPLPAQALGTARFKTYPTSYETGNPASRSWFIYNLARGKAATSSLTIVSSADTPIGVSLYPVDATTTNDGSFALQANSDPRKGIGAWVELSQQHLILQPGQTVAVPFTITIPDNADVGDHIGGIAAQEDIATSTKVINGASVNIISRIGTRIYETVPGKQVSKLELVSFKRSADSTGGHSVFDLSLYNSGTVSLQPKATITVTDIFGRKLGSAQLTGSGSIAPLRSATYHIATNHPVSMPIRLTAKLAVSYGAEESGATIQRRLGYFAFGWTTLAVAAIVAGLLYSAIQLSRRFTIRRR